MKKILLFSVVLSAILSCHKSSEHIWEDDMAEALLRIQYGCTSTPDNIFFRALIGGEDFCMSTDQPVSGASPQLVFQLTPKHPNDPININDTSLISARFFQIFFYSSGIDSAYKPYFILQAPKETERLSTLKLYERYLKKGVSLPIRGFLDKDSSKFSVLMRVPNEFRPPPYRGSNTIYYSLDTQSGDQPNSSILVFDDVVRTESVGNRVVFNVKGHFDCKMYRSNGRVTRGLFYKDFKNAQFKFYVTVEK